MMNRPYMTPSMIFRLLFCLILTLLLSVIPNRNAYSDGDCGDCQNPLVQIMPLQIGGDIPDFSDYAGWEEIKQGMTNFCDDWARGFEVATNFMKNNPCADIYYEMENPNPYGETIHIGPLGKAKYEVRSWASIEKVSEGEQTVVKHVKYKITPLEHPKTTPGGNLQWNDLEELSNQLELVPLLGRIQISHDLVALKNGQIYDSGTEILDWVSQPPTEEDSYFDASGESLNANGQTYSGGDGIILGEFSSMTISGSTVFFDNGDIGKTIRKKETPVVFNIRIDDQLKFPPYYVIKVDGLKNELGETLPDNVRIGLKVHHGEIMGGEESYDWRLFNTVGGKVDEQILYKPPACKVAKSDILEYAGVCEFNDFPPYIMEKRYEMEIPNSQCYDATITATSTYVLEVKSSKHSKDANGVEESKFDKREIMEATVTMALELESSYDVVALGEIMETYYAKTRTISGFRYDFKATDYSRADHESSGFEQTITEMRQASGQKFSVPVGLPQPVILMLDKKTKKVKKVLVGEVAIDYKLLIMKDRHSRRWSKDEGEKTETDSDREDKDEQFEIGPVEEEIVDPTFNPNALQEYLNDMFKGTGMKAPPVPTEDNEPDMVHPEYIIKSGDRETNLSGEGKVTKDENEDNHYKHEERTYKWKMTRKKK